MGMIKIYVGNIPQSARNSELKELFEKFGKVVECDILKEFAFVHMDDTNDAKAAIAGLNDSLWKGCRVRVELSTTKTNKGEPSMRKLTDRRGRSYERDRGRSPPGYMRGNGRDHGGGGRGYDNRFDPNPYRQHGNDMRGPPMRDSRYGPPHLRGGRPYPDHHYDRRGGFPHDQRLPPRGGQGFQPGYPFHSSSYREPMRDNRGHYADQYGRPPMNSYGQSMSYYRGPPPNASRYHDSYPPQGYPNSRQSRYSPPPHQSREMYNRGMSRGDEQPTFNGMQHRNMSPSLKSKRHRSSNSRSSSPAQRTTRNGNPRAGSYSRSVSPVMAVRGRNGHHHNNAAKSSSRSQSPNVVSAKPFNGNTVNDRSSESRSRSVSPVQVKLSRRNHRKSKKNEKNSSASPPSSANSSFNEKSKRKEHQQHVNSSKSNGHSHKKSSRQKRHASSSLSRSRSHSSTRDSPHTTTKA